MDTCTETIANIQKHTQEAVINMREAVENQKLKSMDEFKRVHTKIVAIHKVLDELPNKVL